MSKGSRFKTHMSKGSRCKIRMLKANELNILLIHMLLINNLWLNSIKDTQVRILPTGKVTYSGEKIKCHIDKILQYGDKILINKDGILNPGLLRRPKCLLI